MSDSLREEIRKTLNKLFEQLSAAGCTPADTFEVHHRIEEALLDADKRRETDNNGGNAY
jgi:hypothetical protein